MNYLLAVIYGAAAGVIAILLHQSFPPIGVITSLVLSYSAIWFLGRRYGSRLIKWVAAAGWLAIIFRGASYGEGQELLVQGDGVGSALLLIGTLVVLAAVAARN